MPLVSEMEDIVVERDGKKYEVRWGVGEGGEVEMSEIEVK